MKKLFVMALYNKKDVCILAEKCVIYKPLFFNKLKIS